MAEESLFYKSPLHPENNDRTKPVRILIVLGSRVRPNAEALGGFIMPLISENATNAGLSGPREVSGGDVRAKAANIIHYLEDVPDGGMMVVTTGGNEKDLDLFSGSRAEAMAYRLTHQHAYDQKQVEVIQGKGSTAGNAEALMQFLERHKAVLPRRELIEMHIVTNGYHMLRAWTMFSIGMYNRLTESDFVKDRLQPKHKSQIFDLIKYDEVTGSVNRNSVTWEEMEDIRLKVKGILSTYFEQEAIDFHCDIAEKKIEEWGKAIGPKQIEVQGRVVDVPNEHTIQAGTLRNNPEVHRTSVFELKGLGDLLSGKYTV